MRAHQPRVSEEANEAYWKDLKQEDLDYLLGPRDVPNPCPWCGGRYRHSAGCKEMLAEWSPIMPFGKYRGVRACENSGISRYCIAKAIGIDESGLGNFFRGERGLSTEAMDALGEYMGLSIVVDPKKRKEDWAVASVYKRGGSRAKSYWYASWFDRRRRSKCTWTTDKATAERIANKHEVDVALRREGAIDPTLDAIGRESKRIIESHLIDYGNKLRAAGRGEGPQGPSLQSAA